MPKQYPVLLVFRILLLCIDDLATKALRDSLRLRHILTRPH